MANKKHLVILRRGVVAWGKWREANPETKADLSGADLSEADLNGVNLNGVNLSGADLSEADLSEASLNHANLSEVDLSKADLSEASLIWANLSGANLSGANFSGANLNTADLREANLSRANLSGAILFHTYLNRADFTKSDLSGADLRKAFLGSTLFVNVDLRTVKGLDEVEHNGPSSIGIDTLYRSEGQIPEAFLRGCGVPDALIEYLPSLIGAFQPIQYYSCFISYSGANEEFARRLHGRMQQAGLRVWFAPHDLKGGHKLYDQIDEAIRIYDKLIIVLSEASIRSGWVETELRKAFQKEQREKRRTLFPIGLVDYVILEGWQLPDSSSGKDLAEEVRGYFVPDFSQWKEHDAFEVAFARLLADLKVSTEGH